MSSRLQTSEASTDFPFLPKPFSLPNFIDTLKSSINNKYRDEWFDETETVPHTIYKPPSKTAEKFNANRKGHKNILQKMLWSTLFALCVVTWLDGQFLAVNQSEVQSLTPSTPKQDLKQMLDSPLTIPPMKSDDAPLLKILKSNSMQSQFQNLLKGGLTPVIRDPKFMEVSRFKWNEIQEPIFAVDGKVKGSSESVADAVSESELDESIDYD